MTQLVADSAAKFCLANYCSLDVDEFSYGDLPFQITQQLVLEPADVSV